MSQKNLSIIPDEIISSKIYVIRDKKVILDQDLAVLYNVETRVLKQAVKRNIERFPDDFMFELSNKEFSILRSQSVTSSWGVFSSRSYSNSHFLLKFDTGSLNLFALCLILRNLLSIQKLNLFV